MTMTEKEHGDVILLKADAVQIHVPYDPRDGKHSYRSITDRKDEDGHTVQIEAGYTWFRYRGETFRFDGVRWFPGIHGDRDNAEVALVYSDGFYPDEDHGLNNLRLDRFADMVASGELEPREDPDITHD